MAIIVPRGRTPTILVEAGDSVLVSGVSTVSRYRKDIYLQQTTLIDSTNVTTSQTFGPYSKTVELRIFAKAEGVTYAVTDGFTKIISPTMQLPKWRNAVARVRAGSGRAREVILGDSTTMGIGAGSSGTTNSVGAFANGPVRALAARQAAYGVATSDNSFMGDQGVITLPTAYPSYDTRVVYGSGWSAPAGGSTSTLAGQMFFCTSGTAGNLAFTPVGQCDTAIVFYARSGSNGQFTWNVDGGSSLGTVTTSGGPTLSTVTATFTKGAHTINIVPSNNGNIYIVGIIAYDSTVPAVDIIQAGWAGALIASFNITTSPWHSRNALATLAPDLTRIQLTINDSNAGTNLSSYSSTLQAIVTAALVSGDCIIESGIPSGTTAATNGTLATYVAAARAVADANNIPFIDVGARWVDYATANARGWMFDTLHPNALGYQDEILPLANMLAYA